MRNENTGNEGSFDQAASNKTVNVLVVENDKPVSVLLKHVLACGGATVYVVTNYLEALKKLKETQFDLIFINISIPEGDGFKLISLARNLQPNLDIVTMTAENTKEVERQARQQRITYHLVKPFKIYEAHSILQHIVNKRSAVDQPLIQMG